MKWNISGVFVCVCLEAAANGMAEVDDDVSSMTSAVSVASVAICAAAVFIMIVLAVFLVARRKRLLSTR